MPVLEKDFCVVCGWVRPIVRTERRGRKEVKFCATCDANPPKELDTAGLASDVRDAFGPLTKGMVDMTEKTRMAWNKRPPPGEMQDAIAQRRELRRWFRRGVLLGALMATGIAFAFFNFIRGWS